MTTTVSPPGTWGVESSSSTATTKKLEDANRREVLQCEPDPTETSLEPFCDSFRVPLSWLQICSTSGHLCPHPSFTIERLCKGLTLGFRAFHPGSVSEVGKHRGDSQPVTHGTFFADFRPCDGSLGFCCFTWGEVGCTWTNTTHGLRRAWVLLSFVLLRREARTLYALGMCSVTKKEL